MRLREALPLIACKTLWGVTGLRWAGRALVRALGQEDEDLRTLAGMFLVRAGRRAGPLLHEALARRENLPMVLSILADIGDSSVEPELRQFAGDRDPQVAAAARNALRVLQFQR